MAEVPTRSSSPSTCTSSWRPRRPAPDEPLPPGVLPPPPGCAAAAGGRRRPGRPGCAAAAASRRAAAAARLSCRRRLPARRCRLRLPAPSCRRPPTRRAPPAAASSHKPAPRRGELRSRLAANTRQLAATVRRTTSREYDWLPDGQPVHSRCVATSQADPKMSTEPRPRVRFLATRVVQNGHRAGNG